MLVEDGTQPRMRVVYKGWLTKVKGQTFLTMEPVETIGAVNGDDRAKVYMVLKVVLEGNTLTASQIDPEFKGVKDLKTSEALERLVAENLEDAKLFVKPIVAVKWTPDQMKGLEKLQETFREWKP
jgi:hypothetical protein